MVTIYNTTLSATSQRHFSDGLGGGWPTLSDIKWIFFVLSVALTRTKGPVYEMASWDKKGSGVL